MTNTNDAAIEPGPPQRWPGFGLAVCFLFALCVIAFRLYAGIHDLKLSWDDGSITAAFARTWAQSGRIALTPVSQTVEGFSSLLWFLLLSIPYFFSSDNNIGLVWMKVLSAAFAVLSLPLVYRIALRQLKDHATAIVCMLVFAFCVTTSTEIENGMEMNLAAFLLLLLFYLLTREDTRRRVLYACAVIALLLLARFETPFMLAFLAVGLWLAQSQHRPEAISYRDLIRIALFTTLCFLAIELWRYHTFHVWMPNTVYAKQQFPYRDWYSKRNFITAHLKAVDEPFHALRLLLPIAFLLWLRGIYRKEASWSTIASLHPAVLSLSLGCFLFGALFSKNTGYPGRMVASMLPFLILAAVGVCVRSVHDTRSIRIVLALVLVANWVTWYHNDVSAPWKDTGIREVEWLGLGADAVRVALHRDRLVTMIGDVGGSSMCCERLEIIDSDFLADTTLSHTGYTGFESYFRKIHPDIVEAHSYWAIYQGVYDRHLLDDYSIVASRGVRFFLRNDLYRQLAQDHPQSIVPVEQIPACLAWYPNDTKFSLTKGTCLVLNDPDKQRNLDSKPKH